MVTCNAIRAISGAVLLLTAGILSACGGGGATAEDIQQQRALCANGNTASCRVLGSSGSSVSNPLPATSTNTAATTTTATTTTPTSTAGAKITLNPSALTIGDCTTNIPFFFSGGTPPYTIFTTDNFKIPVSSAQPLGSEYFFLASVGPLILRVPKMGEDGKVTYSFSDDYPDATLTVVDSEQRMATAKLHFPVIHLNCPDNPLLVVSPASANAHVSEILAFQVGGGNGTFVASSSDERIATVVEQGAFAFNVQAKAAGTALITVSGGDGQKANIVFTVLPLQ